MSGRKLGGGRILGTGKGLAPPSAAHVPRAASPFALSESSTVSWRSRNSTPSSPSPPSSGLLPDCSQDLAANIGIASPSDGASSDNRLLCPICEEEMLTLLQLNRHIDDVHQELPAAEQDEVKSWLDKQVLKAKRFQPLSIINQKLRGLEVFESNETQLAPALPAAAGGSSRLQDAPTAIDPEELVTRKHWQKPTGSDVCTDPACGRRLGPLNGSINCRKCGRLFCETHTMYQMKLSRSAGHDPARGVWCRVCETCYKSREGYNDHNGFLRDRTDPFVAVRKKKVERQNLEIARLEKRLTKLTTLLAFPPEERPGTPGGGLLSSSVTTLAGQKTHRKLIEQSVVTWEDDAKVARCPFCQQEFGSWTFRRHHCRVCGRVVCADPQTECSREVGLSVQMPTSLPTEKTAGVGQISVDLRMCRDCRTTIFSKRDFARSVEEKPPVQRAYETLRQFERGIRQLMPAFQRTMMALQIQEESGGPRRDGSGPTKPPPTHAQIQEAAKIRKRLTDSFTKYNIAAKRLRDLKTDSPTQLRLQRAIYGAASTFLHTHMLPLKSVPNMLRSGSSSSHRRFLSGLNSTSSHMSPLRNGELAASSDPDTASLGGVSEASTAMSALETEEKELRERLVVLEEQRFLVSDMINNARGSKRFEEVAALTRNKEELDGAIEALKKQVSGVEKRWEALYSAGV